jgi:hypothetical protein
MQASCGTDIGIFQGSIRVGTANGIGWSITREAAPLYIIDESNKRKPAVAGTIIFQELDKDHINGDMFDVCVVGVDEYGKLHEMKLLGLNLINEDGTILEREDITCDDQILFKADSFENWRPNDNK